MTDTTTPPSDIRLTPAERLMLAVSDPAHAGISGQLYAWLAAHFGPEGSGDYPGTGPLARAFSAHRHTVLRAEETLTAMGWLTLTGGPDRKKLTLATPANFPEARVAALRDAMQGKPVAKPSPAPRPPRKPRKPREPRKPQVEKVEVAVERAPEPPAADDVLSEPPTPPPADPKPAKKATSAGLTDEEKAAILTDVNVMERYLLWGKAAIPADVDISTLEPVATNWRKHLVDRDPNVDKWGIPEFMGFYWYSVSRWRTARQIQLTLPMWKRMAGDFKNLLATMTKADFHMFIRNVVMHFDLIRFQLRNLSAQVALNETSLSTKLIKDTAFNIGQMDEAGLNEAYEQLKKVWG